MKLTATATLLLLLTLPSFSQTETPVHSFQGQSDGSTPSSGIASDGHGYYGVTSAGGCDTNDCGVLYKFKSSDLSGSILHVFNPGDNPAGSILFIFPGEDIFGVTRTAGQGFGQVYHVFPRVASFREIHAFNGTDGAQPNGDLAFVSNGQFSLVGTTENGGASDQGVIYAVLLNGVLTFKPLYTFTGGLDGGHPTAGLVFDGKRNGYGVTTQGGTASAGTIYKISLSPTGLPFKTIYNFTGGTDGATPAGTLLLGKDGALYGTTQAGGDPTCNCGTVFKLSVVAGSWTLTTLYTFLGGNDGANPASALLFDASGNLWGTTPNGGACSLPNGCGTVFKLTPNGGSWTESVYYSFLGGSDGATPVGTPLIVNGVVYGATEAGGDAGRGTFFQIQP